MKKKHICIQCKEEFVPKREDKYGTGTYEWNYDCPECKSSLHVYEEKENCFLLQQKIIGVYQNFGQVIIRTSDEEWFQFSPTVHQDIKIEKIKK